MIGTTFEAKVQFYFGFSDGGLGIALIGSNKLERTVLLESIHILAIFNEQ